MRCLHCGKRIALLRKFRKGQYCSDEHQVLFTQKQEELALSRLIEVQQQALSPTPRRPLFAATRPERSFKSAPGIAWLVATEVEIQGAPLRFRVPAADPFEFEFLWLYPQFEFARPKRRWLRAGTALPVFAPAAVASPICQQCDAERFAISLAIPSRPAFQLRFGVAGQLLAVPFDPLALALVPRAVACEPAILEAIPGVAAASSVRLATALRPAGSVTTWAPAPLTGEAPRVRVADLSIAIEAGRVGWKSLTAPGPIAPVVTEPPPIELPAESQLDRLLALQGPALKSPIAKALLGDGAIGAQPATLAPIPQAGLRAARLRRCGLKVSSLRTPAIGNQLPVSGVEGEPLVSVRFRLPKRASRQQNSDLGFARRMPPTIPLAGRIRVRDGEKPEALPPPRFLVPPPISVTPLRDFSPPQFPMCGVPVQPVECASTGQRYEYPHVSQTIEPELLLPVGPVAPPDFGEPSASHYLAAPQAAPIAPAEAGCKTTDAEPLLAAETLILPLQAHAPAEVRSTTPAGRVALLRLGHEKIVPQPAAPKPKWIAAAQWPSPAPLMPPSTRLRSSFGPGRDIDRRTAPWRLMAGASQVWQRVPTPVKWSGALMALVLTVMFGWNAAGPSPQTVSASTEGTASFFSGTLRSVKIGILRRAAISLTDDFRLGLSEWEGEGDWATGWSYDTAGFVRIGSMALYSPSLALVDYRMEFLGQIERKGMSWAVRAADYKNYYAVKLAIVQPGPLPTVAIFRYPVINGIEGKAVQVPLRIQVRSDTVYRVMIEARGDNFTLAVNGNVVDTWTESRLPKGGVGFFSGKGERARLRWVGVWHQYDTLGRLCAYLAPLGISSKDRSINQ